MLTKVVDVIFQCLWRQICHFKPQKFSMFVWICTFVPHFEKGSVTHGSRKGTGGKAPLDFEIWHFPITVLAKNRRFPSFKMEKWNFNIFGPPWKNPSDTQHACVVTSSEIFYVLRYVFCGLMSFSVIVYCSSDSCYFYVSSSKNFNKQLRKQLFHSLSVVIKIMNFLKTRERFSI